jgi:signal transduction histidine kinase/CheY-like chemotaxis protein
VSKRHVPSSVFALRLNSGLALLGLFVAILVAVLLEHSLAAYEARALTSSRNLSLLLMQDIDAWFDKIDLAVLAVKDEAERTRPGVPEDGAALDRFIARQVARQPELDALRVMDSEGRVLYGTGVSTEHPVSADSRVYFQRLRSEPSLGLVVSEPFLGQISGKWSLAFARRISGPDGAFRGVAYAVLYIDSLTQRFAELDLGPRGVVSLRNLDLGTVARYPEPKNVPSTGNRTFSKEWAELVRRQPQAGTYLAAGLDGRQRALAYNRVTQHPFFVIVGLDPEDYLAPWAEEATHLVGVAIVFFLIAFGLSRMLSSTWKDREAVSGALLFEKGQALARSEDRLQSAMQAAEMGVWIFHPAEQTFSASERTKTLLGVAADASPDLISLLRHMAPEDRRRVRDAVDSAVRSEPSDLVVLVSPPRGDPRSVAWTIRWMPGTPGHTESVVALLRDVTAAQDVALEQQRKDEFLAMLSHELRGPLAPIRTSFEIMRLSQDPAVIERSAGVVDRQLRQLLHLVDDLLDLSRVTQGKLRLRKRHLDLRAVLQGAVEATRPVLDARAHRLSIATPGHEQIVDGDETRLVQVFSNLLTNAAKYTPPGGRVSLALRVDGTSVEVEVADDGDGIPAETLPHVFEMFTQGRSSHGQDIDGLGVGLGLVKRLVEMHGGRVTARSEGAGRGSSFIVTLPRVEGAVLPGEAPADPAGLAHTVRGMQILVVDDDEDGRESLALLLQVLGHEVVMAPDGHRALDVAAVLKPDIVFLDLGMPGIDGIEVATRLRARQDLAGVVIVALTGWGQEHDKEKTRQAGIDHHLTKPASSAQLEGLIAQCEAARPTRSAPPSSAFE